MSKHTLMVRGKRWEWDDNDTDINAVGQLLRLHQRVGEMHSHSMYEGKDPYERWNTQVNKLQNCLIDWIEAEEAAEASNVTD